MNKTIIYAALSSVFTLTTASAYASLPTNAKLGFDPGVESTTIYGSVVVKEGSYFGMDTNGGGISAAERTAIEEGATGLYVNATQSGAGDIDLTWQFFTNPGNHTTISDTTILSDDGAGNVTLDFSGWNVTWNAIPLINMGGGTQDCGTASDGICVTSPPPPAVGVDIAGVYDNGTGIATLKCYTDAALTVPGDCSVGNNYTLDYDAVVPQADPSNFGGVSYTLHMVSTIGSIGLQPTTNTAPVAVDDNFTVDRKASGRIYTSPVLDIIINDTDVDGGSDIDRTSVTILSPANGITVIDPLTGDITYTPVDDSLASDSFTYEVTDLGGPQGAGFELTSNVATVNITVQNSIPVAVDDLGSIDTSTDNSIDIDVTSNDTDADGTIDDATVEIITPATNGITNVNASTGVVTYTPVSGFIGIDTFTYTVKDDDATLSNVATVTVSVSAGAGILDPAAFLIMETGNVVNNIQQPPLGDGSWFSMEVQPGVPLYTPIAGFNHLQLGKILPASSNPLVPNIDQGWQFFGNIGVHQTTAPVTIITDDSAGNVTLGFSGWDVSWNAIPSIPLGSGQDNGIATMTCYTDLALLAQGTCIDGDKFIVEYQAIVPPGDPSGFGGVNYVLHMEGVVSAQGSTIGGGDENAPYNVTVAAAVDAAGAPKTIAPGAKASDVANTTGFGLTEAEIGVSDPLMNPKDGVQCVGGCADFVISDVTTDYIDIVFKLTVANPSDSTAYRKLINGKWVNFDSSAGNLIGSANTDVNGNCQGPEGVFSIGLRAGTSCVYLRIYDGGTNDADGLKDGKVTDPSGVLLAGSPNTPAGSTSGCSISGKKVSISERADWIIVAGFVIWLGLLAYHRKKAVR